MTSSENTASRAVSEIEDPVHSLRIGIVHSSRKSGHTCRIESQIVIVGEVNLSTNTVTYFSVESWKFNDIWIGDCDSGRRFEDLPHCKLDVEIQQVLLLRTNENLKEKLDGLVLEIATGSRFNVTPIPLPVKPRRCGPEMPVPRTEVASSPGRDIYAVVVLNDTTSRLDPYILPRSIRVKIGNADGHGEFLHKVRNTSIARTDISVENFIQRGLAGKGTISAYVMVQVKGSTLLYNWEQEFNSARKA